MYTSIAFTSHGKCISNKCESQIVNLVIPLVVPKLYLTGVEYENMLKFIIKCKNSQFTIIITIKTYNKVLNR